MPRWNVWHATDRFSQPSYLAGFVQAQTFSDILLTDIVVVKHNWCFAVVVAKKNMFIAKNTSFGLCSYFD